LTYIGYSQGTAQMFYALGTNYDYFKDKINRYVAMAPLWKLPGYDYYTYSTVYPALLDAGIYVFGGESWDENYERLCTEGPQLACDIYSYVSSDWILLPVNSEAYFNANNVEGRF